MNPKYNIGDIVCALSIYGNVEKAAVMSIIPQNGTFEYELNPMITIDHKEKIGNYRREQNDFGFSFRPAKEGEIQIYIEPTPEPQKQEKELDVSKFFLQLQMF